MLLFSTMLLIAGCGRTVELNRHLSEKDANDVIAELFFKHIDAEKHVTKDGVSVSVDADDMARAVRILDAAGLPRQERANMGEIFRKDGVISSPLEERARYIYALSQELESTISQIDGVVVARVHVVLPERIAPGEPVQPASAAVFIKHRANIDPDVLRPRIMRLVRTSIPGLSEKPDKLSVIFVAAQNYRDRQQFSYIGPFLVKQEDVGFWQGMIVIVVVGFFLFVALIVFFLKSEWRPTFLKRRQVVDDVSQI